MKKQKPARIRVVLTKVSMWEIIDLKTLNELATQHPELSDFELELEESHCGCWGDCDCIRACAVFSGRRLETPDEVKARVLEAQRLDREHQKLVREAELKKLKELQEKYGTQ